MCNSWSQGGEFAPPLGVGITKRKQKTKRNKKNLKKKISELKLDERRCQNTLVQTRVQPNTIKGSTRVGSDSFQRRWGLGGSGKAERDWHRRGKGPGYPRRVPGKKGYGSSSEVTMLSVPSRENSRSHISYIIYEGASVSSSSMHLNHVLSYLLCKLLSWYWPDNVHSVKK